MKIYILLSRTKTYTSRFLYRMTKHEFTHTSIALDRELNHLYSFARRNIHIPIIGGFIKEDIKTGIFGKYPDSCCALYELNVTEEAYREILDIIHSFNENYWSYHYSFIGLAFIKLGINYPRKRHFVCSQFVAYVLDASGAAKLTKSPYLFTPLDIEQIPSLKLVYKGSLRELAIL